MCEIGDKHEKSNAENAQSGTGRSTQPVTGLSRLCRRGCAARRPTGPGLAGGCHLPRLEGLC